MQENQVHLDKIAPDAYWRRMSQKDLWFLRNIIAPVMRARSAGDLKGLRFEKEVVDRADQVAVLKASLVDQISELPLTVNVVGCFALGFLGHMTQTTSLLHPHLRVAIGTGFLGALTTYSTFGYETLRLWQDRQWVFGFANIAANILLGLLAVWCGTQLARAVYGS